jgi:iron complex transport system substrate-binding protein
MCLFAGAAGAGARQNSLREGDGARSGFREVTDEVGRTVRIPQTVRRVVSLAPSLTETVYALGLQKLLVGDTDYCDYPPDAMKKHKVGGIINPNMEEVAALRPDLVLVTSVNRMETVYGLEQLGIPTYATDPHTVQEIVTSSRKLAEILGAPEAGAALETDLDRRLAALKEQLEGVAATRVLFVVWTAPLISVGQKTFIADALRHAGAESIVQSSQDWPHVNMEEIVHLQPEYLVFAANHSEEAAKDLEVLAERPGWNSLEAVKERKFAVISDAVNRTAPRIVSAIEDLARQLHPEAFRTTEKSGGTQASPAPAGEPKPKPGRRQPSMVKTSEEGTPACAH